MMEVVRNQDIRPLRCVDTGDGPALVLLHGFAMQPETYLPLARLLTDRIRVVIPAIFALPGRWTFERALACLEATLDNRGLERVSLLGHSFGGGLELGLADAIHPGQYEGCYWPKLIEDSDHLSMHAWGLAFDINVPTNQRMTHGDQDPRMVAIFKKWGFRWGGDWKGTPDPMHFELASLLSSPPK